MFLIETQLKNWKVIETQLKNWNEIQLKLVSCYQEPHRAYHTLIHVETMLDLLQTLSFPEIILEEPSPLCNTPEYGAVELAVWFHDAVYDPKAKNNEERSAELAEKLLKDVLPGKTVALIKRLILLTKTHERSKCHNYAAHLMLDLDLAVFGFDEDAYDFYAAAIRKEYHFVPQKDYAAGRIQVLEKFLRRQKIYKYATWLETQAKENLRREIQYWENHGKDRRIRR